MSERPGFLERLRLAARVFQRGLSHKASPLAWPAWRQGRPEWQIVDVQGYFHEGFTLNSLIYSAVMYKARSLTASPLRAYSGDPERPDLLPPGHPLQKLLGRPNAFMSGLEFQQLSDVYLNLAGEAFILLDRPKSGALPTALYTLRPDRVFPVPDTTRGLKGFLYVPEGRAVQDGTPILVTDMLHVKLPNPLDPLEGWGRGLSPLSPAAMSADVDNDVTRFLKTFFQHGTMTSTVLTFKDPLDDTTLARIKKRWQEMYGGWERWSEVGVLDNGGTTQRLGMTFEEMGFGAVDERNESRILGPFGVPGLLLGTRLGLNRAIRANAQELRRLFWEDTFLPELRLFETEFAYGLSEDAIFPRYDLSGVPALQHDVPKLIEGAHKLWTMGVPASLALETVGLPIADVPAGDVAFLPASVQRSEDAAKPPAPVPAALLPGAAPPAADTPEPPPADQSNDGAPNAADEPEDRKAARLLSAVVAKAQTLSEEAKQLAWKATDAVATSHEGAFAEGAETAFEQDKRAVLAAVGEAKALSRARKGTLDWRTLESDVLAYFRDTSPTTWRETFTPLLEAVITDQAKTLQTSYGLELDVRNALAEQWFEQYQLQFAQPISQTSSDELSTLLQQAQREGWTTDTLSNRLGQVFKQWMQGGASAEDFSWLEQRMPPERRELIARTETMRAANAGSTALFKQAGVEQKEWLATQDSRTRDSHKAANGQVVGIDAAFTVGGYAMQYPGDPSAPADETVQCRCVSLPVLEGGS